MLRTNIFKKILITLAAVIQLALGFQKVQMPLDQFIGLPYRNASDPASSSSLICQVRLASNAVYFCNNGFVGAINAQKLFGVWGTQSASPGGNVQDSG